MINYVAVTIEKERDALREALAELMYEEVDTKGNEEGETFVQCDRCNVSAWGDNPLDIAHDKKCPFVALEWGRT